MGRWAGYTQRESPWAIDGDPSFRGVNMLIDRGSLPAGYLARSENKRLRDGAAATRAGTTFASDFNPAFENPILGSEIYSNPNGEEVMLVATSGANYVWALQFNKDPLKIALQSPQTIGIGFVNFVQAFDKVLLLRYPFLGDGHHAMVWDGDTSTIVGGMVTPGFVPVTLSADGMNLIPSTVDGVPFQNRILLYNPYYAAVPWRDQLLVTDALDYTSYDDVLGLFRINAGESDLLTSVVPYYRGGTLVMMLHSIHMLENFTIDPLHSAAQRMLNAQIGSVGYKMPVQVGADVMFLSRPGGIFRVSQVITDTITTPAIPVSRAIQPIIDRINWDRANLYACSAQLGDYVYFALPLDQNTGASDCVVVLNSVTNEWESAPDWWDDPTFRINRLHRTLYNESIRVFAVDYAASRIYVLYDGFEDEINDDILPVHDLIETRGYTVNEPGGFKRFQRATIGIRTFDPAAQVTALSDGVNEEKVVGMITKDRLRFYVHGHPPFDPIAGDPGEPKREDYSSGIDDAAIEDFEDLPLGPIYTIPPGSTVFNGVKQQSLERFQIRQNGRWCSIRVENSSGICDVLGVGVEAIPAQEGIKAVA